MDPTSIRFFRIRPVDAYLLVGSSHNATAPNSENPITHNFQVCRGMRPFASPRLAAFIHAPGSIDSIKVPTQAYSQRLQPQMAIRRPTYEI